MQHIYKSPGSIRSRGFYIKDPGELTNQCAARRSSSSRSNAPTVIPVGSTVMCQGDSIMLVASIANSYLWSNGDTTQSIFISPEVNTDYSVIVHDSTGCIDSAMISMIIKIPDTAYIT